MFFYWYFIEISTGFPMQIHWYFIEISIEFQLDFDWKFIVISTGCPLDFHCNFNTVSTGLQMFFDSYYIEISTEFSAGFPNDVHKDHRNFNWTPNGFQLVFHWNFNWISNGYSLVFHWNFYWTSTGFPMCQHMASLLPEVSPHKQDQVDQEEASVCEWSCHGQAPETALVRPTLRLPLSATLSTSSTKFSMNSASYSTSLGAVEKNFLFFFGHLVVGHQGLPHNILIHSD